MLNKSKLSTALEHARRGYPVFPLHTPTENGACSCNKTACSSIGKHPRTRTGLKEATTDQRQIKEWWKKWPDANIGICTGEASGFIALDVDPRNGGSESLAKLEKENETLPKTVESVTGGNGRHIFFKYPKTKIKNGSNVLGPGLDIKANGGYIVAPGSLHSSGNKYKWLEECSPEEYEIAEMPDWLENLLPDNNNNARTLSPTSEKNLISEGQRNTTLTSLAGTMHKKGMSDEAILAALMEENTSRCKPPLHETEVCAIAESICKYPKGSREKESRKKEVKNYTARFPGLIDIVDHQDEIHFLTTDGLKDSIEINGSLFYPPPREQIPWLIPSYEKVKNFIGTDTDEQLFDDLVSHFKKVSILPVEDYYYLITTWVIHTYLLEHFNYSPLLTFDADADRGKTRTGKAIIYCAYRGMRLTDIREANCLRYSHDLNAAIFFDLRDVIRSAKKQNCMDILLNRFEKGSRVSRVYNPDQGAFKDVKHYEIFGPTIIATNESMDYIVESRGINIDMPELDEKSLKQFDNDIIPESFLEFKERLTALRFRNLNKTFNEIPKPISKRLGDVMRPLLKIAHAIKPTALIHLENILKNILNEKKASRSHTIEAAILNALIHIKEAQKNPFEEKYSTTDIITVNEISRTINQNRENFKDKISSNKIGYTLKKLGFKRTRGEDNTAAYLWDEDLVKKLCQSWGLEYTPTSP